MEEIDLPELESIRIPDKTHFKIGEVAKLLDLEPYVLRYWEKEFDVLSPGKTDSGQRSYQRDDIELLATIQRLLHTEEFTIDGARRQITRARDGKPSYLTMVVDGGGAEVDEDLEAVRQENEQLRLELEETSEAHEEERDERERLEARVAELESELDEKTDAHRERRDRFEAQIAKLESQLDEARAEQGADPEKLRQLEAKVGELQEKNETLRHQLGDARKMIEELESQNRKLEEAGPAVDGEVLDALHGHVDALSALAE